MARRFTIELLMNLAKSIGANPNKFMGTKTNITFLGKGPTKNPLFQSRLAGLENATMENLGKPETLVSAVEDAMSFASAGKLNSIQTEILGHNLLGIKNIIKPPVLPSASVTDIAPGIEGLRRFPKETHQFMGRPLKGKDFSEIDRMVMEGKIPDARGRTWDLKTPKKNVEEVFFGNPKDPRFYKSKLPETGPEAFNAALNQKTGMSRAIARELLLQDTRLTLKPEELFMLKSGKGEPLDLMRKYYGDSIANLDTFLDDIIPRPGMNPRDLATRVLSEVELIPQFAEGGLAEVLQVPRSGMRIGGLGLLTRGIRAALKRTHKAYDNPGADFAALMDNPSYLLSPVNMQKIKKLELYRKQLVRDIVRKEGGGEFTHGPKPEAIRADLQLLDDYIAQLKNKIKEVGYYGQGAAAEKALVQERNALSNKLPFSKFVRDKFKHAEGGLARILEV